MSQIDWLELEDCTCILSTPLALLVHHEAFPDIPNYPATSGQLWIPRSVVDSGRSDIHKTQDTGTLVVAMWWAEKNNITEAGEEL